jgi:ornithine carbamoyltransferase
MTRHLLDVDDLSAAELHTVLDLAEHAAPPRSLVGTGMALIFEKPSARTRNSMEMAIVQLGGHPVSIRPDEIGLGTRETIEDLTRMFCGFYAAIGARVFDHEKLERMAAVSTVPVVNMLSDVAHPLQALADLQTIRHAFGTFEDRTVAYVGDGNNVCRSLAMAAALVGMHVQIGCPVDYLPSEKDQAAIRTAGATPLITTDPVEAVAGADVIYTDAWFSMGQEEEASERRPVFQPFQVNAELMAAAAPGAIFLHCLPAHRNEEVTDEVIDGPHSWVWPQAENRMHAARGLLSFLVDDNNGVDDAGSDEEPVG